MLYNFLREGVGVFAFFSPPSPLFTRPGTATRMTSPRDARRRAHLSRRETGAIQISASNFQCSSRRPADKDVDVSVLRDARDALWPTGLDLIK